MSSKNLGFGAEIRTPEDRKRTGELLASVRPDDLLKYGLIPEFVGRFPVMAVLDDLDEAAFYRILTEPKNALVKQFEKLFALEKVRLRMTEGALKAIAHKAFIQKTGARGLRAILEEVMLDLMYEIPSVQNVLEVLVTEETINNHEPPGVVRTDTTRKESDPPLSA